MARTADHRRPPQEQRAPEPETAVVVLTSEGQRRLAVRAAWLATELVPRLAHNQDGWASGEYERAVSELARLARILGQARTTDELPPEDPGIVELGDEVVVEFAAGPGAGRPPGRRAGGGRRPRRSLPCRILTTGRYQTAAPPWPRPAAAG
jgi:hypothetical protein